MQDRRPNVLGDDDRITCQPQERGPEAIQALDARLRSLERTARRQRLAIGALAGVLAAGALLGAAAQQRTNDLVCRKLAIVDGNGGARLVAQVQDDGHSSLALIDRNGSPRIRMQVNVDSSSSIAMLDGNGRNRVAHMVGTDGSVLSSYADPSGAQRILVGVQSDGTASVFGQAPNSSKMSMLGFGVRNSGDAFLTGNWKGALGGIGLGNK